MEGFDESKRTGIAGLQMAEWLRILITVLFFPIGLIFLVL